MKITPTRKKELQDKYDGAFTCISGKHEALFCVPSFKIWRISVEHMKISEIKFAETLITNCFIEGDEEIKTDDANFLSLKDKILEEITFEETPEYEKKGNAFEVNIGGFKCLLKACDREMIDLAQRANKDGKVYKTEEFILDKLWISGDEELRTKKEIKYYVPLLGVVQDVRQKKLVSLKKLF